LNTWRLIKLEGGRVTIDMVGAIISEVQDISSISLAPINDHPNSECLIIIAGTGFQIINLKVTIKQ